MGGKLEPDYKVLMAEFLAMQGDSFSFRYYLIEYGPPAEVLISSKTLSWSSLNESLDRVAPPN